MIRLKDVGVAYATASAGMHPMHTLPLKLEAISKAGFKWTEIALPDLEGYAATNNKNYTRLDDTENGDIDKLVEAASQIRILCQKLGLKVLTLMPFSKYEGYSEKEDVERGLKRAKSWFKVMKGLDCQMIQVGSSDDPSISSDFAVMADNLGQLADLAQAENPPIRIAYEMWAWGTYVNSWEHTWGICSRVDRPNFGLCLDTFQISAIHRIPEVTFPSSLSNTVPAPKTNLEDSLTRLTATLSAHTDKIFYLQISDGARVRAAELAAVAEKQGIHVLYAWSNAYRPLPLQSNLAEGRGGFLPVPEVMKAVLATGWSGPWSYEVFFEAEQSKEDLEIPEKWTQEAMRVHAKLIAELETNELD